MDNNFNNETFNYSQYTPQNNYTPNGYTPKPKKDKKKYGLLTVVLCVILAAIIGGTTGAASVFVLNKMNDRLSVTDNGESTSKQNTVTNISVDESVESVIEAVALKVTPSVVGIATTAATTSFFGGSSESSGEGSGIVYSADGYIITNYHVIESAVKSSASKIEVFLNGDTEDGYQASVIGYNISNDLAVLKISAKGLTAIELGSAEDLRVGQYVAAIGNPGGLAFMGSVTYGVISGLNRVISDSSTGSEVNLIQTDAAINPGNSGGALVNTKGKLIGVNSSKIAATEYEGMGFAIPIDTVKEICDKIIANKDVPNPYIGITISEKYDAATLERLGYPAGAVVKSVMNGGPAYESGIRSGDIIVEFNGIAINNYSKLNDAVADSKVGSTVKVKIYRSGKYYVTNIIIGSNN